MPEEWVAGIFYQFIHFYNYKIYPDQTFRHRSLYHDIFAKIYFVVKSF